MKTLIKPLLVAFSLFLVNNSTSHAQALTDTQPQASFQSGIFTTAEGKIQVSLDKKTGHRVDVRLTNAAGQVLFVHQMTKQQQIARLRLDVSDLPDGAYQLIITDGKETTRQSVTLNTKHPQESNRLVAIN